LQSFLETFGAKRSQEFYIVRNRPPTEASISSTILARAPTTSATRSYDDAHNPRRFPPSLVGVVGKAWLERLKEMKDYKMNHGDTLVPQRYPANPSLGLWVGAQREGYIIYQKKKDIDEKWRGVEVLDDEVKEERERLTRRLKGMNEERIKLLEAEGFVWDPIEAQWFDRLNELRDYKMNHGDALVPSVYPTNPS
jgi:hypothetical protein